MIEKTEHNEQDLASSLVIEEWKPSEAMDIYTQLEHPNWAPWLEASAETIAGRAIIFPKGQLLIKENGLKVASLSINQIDWDGNPDTLPSWDKVAGKETTDYSETYKSSGNTLVLMSMNVAENSKGKHLPSNLITHTKQLAQELGVEYLIGSFRPSGYGKAKLEHKGFGDSQYPFGYQHLLDYMPLTEYGKRVMAKSSDFWNYCLAKVPGTQKPLDPWLRSLWWSGVQLIKEDPWAMEVHASATEFKTYKATYHPELWKLSRTARSGAESWECGEVGEWIADIAQRHPAHAYARYRESNAWGMIPFK